MGFQGIILNNASYLQSIFCLEIFCCISDAILIQGIAWFVRSRQFMYQWNISYPKHSIKYRFHEVSWGIRRKGRGHTCCSADLICFLCVLRYRNTAPQFQRPPQPSQAMIEFVVSDTLRLSQAVFAFVQLVHMNDPPVIALDSSGTADLMVLYTENSQAQPVAPMLSITGGSLDLGSKSMKRCDCNMCIKSHVVFGIDTVSLVFPSTEVSWCCLGWSVAGCRGHEDAFVSTGLTWTRMHAPWKWWKFPSCSLQFNHWRHWNTSLRPSSACP